MNVRGVALVVVLIALVGCQGANPQGIVGAITTIANPQTVSDARGAFVDIDEPEEIELGRSITAAVGARYRVLRDPALTKYVALVGNAVTATSDRPDIRYYFAVLDTPQINAFAAPGGFVFISRGALDVMADEAALAGVLGHEIGHIALRHHGETIKTEKRKALFVKGGGAFAQATTKVPAASLGFITAAADAVLEGVVVKGHSRGEESESDKVGFQYAARAGYDPAGLREFLAALKAKGPSDAGATGFFSTHPGIDERLQEQAKLRESWSGGGKREAARFAQAVKRAAAKPAATPAQVKPAPKPTPPPEQRPTPSPRRPAPPTQRQPQPTR
jgi:predicted Zn-dependent protease